MRVAPSPRASVCLALAVIWTWIYFWQLSLGAIGAERVAYAFAVVPAVLSGRATLPPELALVAPPWTLLSNLLLHPGALTLVVDLLALWWFGRHVETAMARGRFALFYLVCGIFAVLAATAQAPLFTQPQYGSSAALSGVLAAHVLLRPRARLRLELQRFSAKDALTVPALIPIGLWFVVQFGLPVSGTNAIGWPAHAASMAAGCVLMLFLKRRDTSLFT